MRILFAALSLQDSNGGVDKKIKGQVAALRKLGHDVVKIEYKEGQFVFEGNEIPPLQASSGPVGVYLGLQKAVRAAVAFSRYDLCYTRHIFATPFQLRTLQELKRKGVFTVEEFPTYPYDAELALFKSPVYRAAALCDTVFRKRYKGLLDMCVTYSQDKNIFGVPTVSIENGIDLSQIPFVARRFAPKEVLRLVTVSSMSAWHGYERLLEGLAAYGEKEPHIILDMIGNGPCRQEWEELAKSKGLGDKVQFHSQLLGEELDVALADADIGIASLGMYKIGLDAGSVLKTREYMARGLPFVYAYRERALPQQPDFCLRMENNGAAIDVTEVVAFYHRLVEQKNVSKRQRQFAEEHYTWEIQMKKVLVAAQTLKKR